MPLIALGFALLLAAPRADIVKIWDQAPHNAFPSLVRFKARWYCAFREARGQAAPSGILRVLTSADSVHWDSAAVISAPPADLLDAHLSVTSDDRLMLTSAAVLHDSRGGNRQTLGWFSNDGRSWGDALAIGDAGFWFWHVTWHRGRAYAFAHSTAGAPALRLYTSRDGLQFETLAPSVFAGGIPAAAALLFQGDDTALALLCRPEATAMLGRARPPYRAWTWTDLGVRLASPDMITLPDSRIIAAGRLTNSEPRTGLCWLDPRTGTLREFLTLRSGGDTGYPVLDWYAGRLWVSYYSTQDDRTAIYLAQLGLDHAN